MRLLVKVQRLRQGSDTIPRLQEYGIELSEGLTVLEVLLKIKDDLDGTVSFRCSCRSSICGSCAMEINGTEKLACKTSVADEIKMHGQLVIKPLKGRRIIKDLIVDMNPFWDDIIDIQPWMTRGAGSRKFKPGDDIEEMFNNADNCIMCSACVSACTTKEVSERFRGPAALAKLYRFIADPRDGTKLQRLKDVDKENGIWDCARCYYCYEVCPKHVKPVEAIVRTRCESLKQKVDTTKGAKHINRFYDSVRSEGLVNETALPVKIIGLDLYKQLSMLPLGIKMFVRGKVMPPIKIPIRGMRKVREIFNKFGSD